MSFLNLLEITKNECPSPKIRYGSITAIVSDVSYIGNTLSFTFGRHKQQIQVFGCIGEQWLKDGMLVEVDFDQNTIIRKTTYKNSTKKYE